MSVRNWYNDSDAVANLGRVLNHLSLKKAWSMGSIYGMLVQLYPDTRYLVTGKVGRL